MLHLASNTAKIIDSRLLSSPTTALRGLAKVEGATKACISTKRGLVPSIPAKTAEPGTGFSLSERKKAEGFRTSESPDPVISKTPISSAAPYLFFTERMILN